ncbi:MAG: KH domain-containing protein [Eubacterium sp.]|jgi:spoIIIJ-associated protein|nr:KH domain-containing protein [Eubacterium sp.]
MEKIFNGKTLQEAKDKMYEYFASEGVNEDDIDTQILEQPVKKLFGGVKGEYKINAIVSDRLLKRTGNTTASAEPMPQKPKNYARETAKDVALQEVSKEDHKIIISYLTGILKELGADGFSINVIEKEELTVFDIVGEKLGIAIGRRGETLDALQYLAILANNRKGVPYSRISVDCNGYRDKRAETLEMLAARTAKKVLAQGRRITLEPMNPYERRIIHGKVSEIEGVYSSSTGDEPFRKVVISANVPKYKRSGEGRETRREPRRENNGSGGSYKQSSGFQTSFEREYKRSKVSEGKVEISQDSLDFEKSTSLYGKIEL